MSERLLYDPDYPVYPGEVISEYAEALGWPWEHFVSELGLSEEEGAQLRHGGLVLDPPLAGQLSVVLGRPVQFWLELERRYREFFPKLKVVKR